MFTRNQVDLLKSEQIGRVQCPVLFIFVCPRRNVSGAEADRNRRPTWTTFTPRDTSIILMRSRVAICRRTGKPLVEVRWVETAYRWLGVTIPHVYVPLFPSMFRSLLFEDDRIGEADVTFVWAVSIPSSSSRFRAAHQCNVTPGRSRSC